jgi:hypothetical protein
LRWTGLTVLGRLIPQSGRCIKATVINQQVYIGRSYQIHIVSHNVRHAETLYESSKATILDMKLTVPRIYVFRCENFGPQKISRTPMFVALGENAFPIFQFRDVLAHIVPAAMR